MNAVLFGKLFRLTGDVRNGWIFYGTIAALVGYTVVVAIKQLMKEKKIAANARDEDSEL